MADSARIQELRRRVQQDPATLAFAPLAEELRRAGRLDEAVRVCQTGLALHPEYVSARATLGRVLLEAGDLDTAMLELMTVLGSAPENLTALRGVADIHYRRGELHEALAKCQVALATVGRDPELERLVSGITQAVSAEADAHRSAQAAQEVGLSLDQEAGRAREAQRRLERFLGSILADRERRAAGGH